MSMPVATVFEFPDVTQEQFERLGAELSKTGAPQEGILIPMSAGRQKAAGALWTCGSHKMPSIGSPMSS